MSDLRLDTTNLRYDHPGGLLPRPGQGQSHDLRAGSDLAFEWDPAPGQLVVDDGLRTAVLLSLFCDARAAEDDELPDSDAGPFPDRRGYWGDFLSPLGSDDRWGSRLWLLKGQTLTTDTASRARSYCLEALQWLVSEGIGTVDVQTSIPRRGVLQIDVTITDAITRDAKRWRFAWDKMIEGGV